ncbi:MAG: M17 family peptidase N-terminal domain-containing protein, partial [Woeseia sp.]
MEYFATTGAASRRAAATIVVGVYERGKLGAAARELDAASNGQLQKLVKRGDISGCAGKCTVLQSLDNVRAQRIVVAGLGKISEFGVKPFRKATAAAVEALDEYKVTEIVSFLTLEDIAGADIYYLARYTVETIGNSLYRFTEMKTARQKPAMPLKKIGLAIAGSGDDKKAMLGATHADAIVTSM